MKPDVFLITIDCLRPDYVGAYNHLRRQTPIIDGWAADAVVFTDAVCHVPYTTPSVASLLTGAYPQQTGVRLLLGQLCEPNLVTVAEFARRAGYATGGFPSCLVLNSATGLNRGFDVYRDVTDGHWSRRGVCWQTGDYLNAALDRFLTDAGQQRVFCWLHYFDLHDWHVDKSLPELAGYPRDLRQKVDRQCLREFQDILRRHNRLDDAAIIIAADHGEDLLQHGQRGHGHHLYDSVLRVPLVCRWPGMTDGGKRVGGQVRLIDLVPTLLDLWCIPQDQRPGWLDGRSLVGALRGETLTPVLSYAEASPQQLFGGDIRAVKQFAGPEQRAMRSDEYKLIVREDETRELYHLLDDPLELANLATSRPDVADQLAGQLQVVADGTASRFASVPIAAEDEAIVVKRLRDLGYVA